MTQLSLDILPVEEDTSWYGREKERFITYKYKHLPISTHVLDVINKLQPFHFAHLEFKNDKPYVAFVKNNAMGLADRRTLMRAEVYFKSHFKGVFYDDLLSDIIDSINNAIDVKVSFATTPDEIEEVYTNYDSTVLALAHSCMRYKANNYLSDPIHPVRVYGAGDLAIAYIINNDGQTTDRALCWPDKKVYSRVYGTLNSPLHDKLKKLGYSKSPYYKIADAPSFIGAKLLKIFCCRYRCHVMPYMDENVGILEHADVFMLWPSNEGDEQFSVYETNGLSEPVDEEEEDDVEQYEDEEEDDVEQYEDEEEDADNDLI